MTKERIVGCVEFVDFPEFGVVKAMAKIDTGAFSGALHCTDVKVVRRGLRLKRVLKFTPLGDVSLAKETEIFEKTFVRSSTGHRIRRYIIKTTIVLGGERYPIKIGLSDRSDMKRDVLLGRRFLRENDLIVDVRKNSEFDDEGENTR